MYLPEKISSLVVPLPTKVSCVYGVVGNAVVHTASHALLHKLNLLLLQVCCIKNRGSLAVNEISCDNTAKKWVPVVFTNACFQLQVYI